MKIQKYGAISWKETSQKSDIPGVAIGCDHAGEQVSREDLASNQNSRNQHYLAAPAIAQLQVEKMNKGLIFSNFQSKHHQFCMPYVHRQGMWILKLLHVLKSNFINLKSSL